jgi:AcrR family transcriptional regulator
MDTPKPPAPVAERAVIKAGSRDERVVRSRTTVLNATAELLFERGYSATSIDEIARRSGVAKTTIYRHWSDRTALLRDACSKIGTPLERPDTGNVRDDVTAVLLNLASALRSARWTSVLPSIIDAAERDPEMAAMYSQLQHGYSAVLQDLLADGIGDGALPKDANASALTAMLIGPLFYRRWFSREVVSDAFAREIVKQILPTTSADAH